MQKGELFTENRTYNKDVIGVAWLFHLFGRYVLMCSRYLGACIFSLPISQLQELVNTNFSLK